MPRRRGEVASIAVRMVVRWRGEVGRPHIAPTGDLAGVLKALVTTTITTHHRADILGIHHATSCAPDALPNPAVLQLPEQPPTGAELEAQRRAEYVG
jgi:hypothetical protein